MNNSTQKDSKLAVGYIRTTTGRGRLKMREQMSIIDRAVKDRGSKIVDYYIETGSSNDLQHQPMLRSLLKDAEKSNWALVIVCDRHRLSRDATAYGLIEAELKQKGVEIVLAISDPNIVKVD